MPARLSLEPLTRTRTSTAVSAIATNPWSPLAAVGSQKQVLLYNTQTTPIAARSSFGAASTGKGGMKVTDKPGPFEKSVRLHILNAEPYRKDGTEEILWSCHTVMPKVPNTSPRFEDLLLAASALEDLWPRRRRATVSPIFGRP